MRNFSGLGLGLSLVFGCLLLALIAELYYLVWWKKKRITDTRDIHEEYGNFTFNFNFIFWKRSTTQQSQSQSQSQSHHNHPDLSCNNNDIESAQQEKDSNMNGGGGVESEVMRLHNMRLLFTIKEETREDLESEDGRRSRTRSLSDLMAIAASLDTPFLTPLQSPILLKSPPMTTTLNNNPLFESSEAEIRSSPPPKFKFLRDAEDKLYRRLLQEAENRKNNNNNSNNVFAFVPQCTSGSSQVLPLASSPSAFKLVQTNNNNSSC